MQPVVLVFCSKYMYCKCVSSKRWKIARDIVFSGNLNEKPFTEYTLHYLLNPDMIHCFIYCNGKVLFQS
jgi:hypothetical protein